MNKADIKEYLIPFAFAAISVVIVLSVLSIAYLFKTLLEHLNLLIEQCELNIEVIEHNPLNVTLYRQVMDYVHRFQFMYKINKKHTTLILFYNFAMVIMLAFTNVSIYYLLWIFILYIAFIYFPIMLLFCNYVKSYENALTQFNLQHLFTCKNAINRTLLCMLKDNIILLCIIVFTICNYDCVYTKYYKCIYDYT